jgi:lipopolysaccharide assembly outer membrane protein LptD (OstA)
MKKALLVTIALLPAVFLPHATSQETQATAQRLSMPVTGVMGPATVSALSIEREVAYPSTIRLKGNVEIKWKGMILNADEATYDEKTGQVEARGIVRAKPYPFVEAETRR